MDIKDITTSPSDTLASLPSENEIWKKTLDLIKKELSEQSFKTWIEPASLNPTAM